MIVDLAVEQGGNVEGAWPAEVVERHGVKIVGHSQHRRARSPPTPRRSTRATCYNFLSAFWDKEAGRPVLDEEIGDAVRLTQGGES